MSGSRTSGPQVLAFFYFMFRESRSSKKVWESTWKPQTSFYQVSATSLLILTVEIPCDSSSTLAHRNRSDFCDLRLRCPSRTPEIAAMSETRESNAAMRFKGAMESCGRFAISGCDFWAPKPLHSAGFLGDLAPSTLKSLAASDCAILVCYVLHTNSVGNHTGPPKS